MGPALQALPVHGPALWWAAKHNSKQMAVAALGLSTLGRVAHLGRYAAAPVRPLATGQVPEGLQAMPSLAGPCCRSV